MMTLNRSPKSGSRLSGCSRLACGSFFECSSLFGFVGRDGPAIFKWRLNSSGMHGVRKHRGKVAVRLAAPERLPCATQIERAASGPNVLTAIVDRLFRAERALDGTKSLGMSICNVRRAAMVDWERFQAIDHSDH